MNENETIQKLKEKSLEFWNKFSKKQKIIMIGSFILITLSMYLFVYIATKPEYVPLLEGNVTEAEIGEIKDELLAKGVQFKLDESGKNILVPKKELASITVDLAKLGYPKTGSITKELFSGMSFSTTEKQYDMMETDVNEEKIKTLILMNPKINDVKVVLNKPKEGLFVTAEPDKASASIAIEIKKGMELNQEEIRGLYYSVSKTTQNLPLENIIITNQNSQILQLVEDEETENNLSLSSYEKQRKIKKDIELDIQNNLQNMLGTLMGKDKVFVYPFVKLNFDKKKTQNNFVEAPDKENNKGIDVSAEIIRENFNGNGTNPAGIAGTGSTDVPGYPTGSSNGNSEYEKSEERVNREVNRIQQEIISNPYYIEDITINIGVEPPNANEPLKPEVKESIKNILENVVASALGEQAKTMTKEQIQQKISITETTFKGKETFEEKKDNTWLYVGIGVGIVVLGIILFFVFRRKKEEPQEEIIPQKVEIQEIEQKENAEEVLLRGQLDKFIKKRPEDFVMLLRNWLQEDER